MAVVPAASTGYRLRNGMDAGGGNMTGSSGTAPSLAFIGEGRDRLGESPLWDPEAGCLYWVDSVAPCIRVLDGGGIRSWPMPQPVGSVGLGPGRTLVAALRDGLYTVDENGVAVALSLRPPPDGLRFNDGKMDRQGRFLSGTMHTAPADAHVGQLVRFWPGGRQDVLETGIGTSNGLCFSPAGDVLYFADSRVGVIWAYPYDGRTGAVGPRRDLVDTLGVAGSQPDGATVDAEGYLWVALVRTGQLGRFTPDGALDRVIDVPVPHPTCPAFGGPALDVLYLTSISDSGRLQSDHPNAGRLVAVQGLGVRGLPEPRFGSGGTGGAAAP